MTAAGEVDWKERSRRQWSADPCGSASSKAPFGTKEYFAEVERFRYEVYAPWIKEEMGFDRHAGERLLEVGVGMGSDHVQWARGGALCTGIDLTPRCIEITRQRLELEGLRSDLRVMDAEKLDFPSESFDLVYSFGVLHHTPDTQEAVDEIYRVLKPGGRAIVMLYHRDSWHVMKLVAMYGLYEGQFARKSLHDLLSEGEAAAERESLPLVKTYSRAEALFLFRRFRNAENIVRQLTKDELTTTARKTATHSANVWVDRTPIRPFPFLPLNAEVTVTPRIDGWTVLLDAIDATRTELSDKAIEELGGVVGWNVVVFARK